MKVLVTSLVYNNKAIKLWHRRIGHLSKADFKRLVEISKGIYLLIKPRIKLIYRAYSIGKSRRKLSRKAQPKIS